jgi:hypothetical protein
MCETDSIKIFSPLPHAKRQRKCYPVNYFCTWNISLNCFKPCGYFWYHQVQHSTFCPKSVFVYFIFISEQTKIFFQHSLKLLDITTEMECVYWAVRTEVLNTGRFIMFSMITNIYNKKTKGPTLMELLTVKEKIEKVFFWQLEMFDGRHDTHRYDIQVLAIHVLTWVHWYSSLL